MSEGKVKKRNQRRKFTGIVTSDKMDKTIVVKVYQLVQHPRYKKYIRKASVLKVHDEKNEAKVGDKVEIMECRRISKTKSWRLVKVIK